MPYIKNKLPVKVPKRSGFDKTHRNSGTGLCGTLIPLLCDEVVPNSRVSLRLPIQVQLPPLVSETYMNLKYKVEAFFVPLRLLSKSFESFFTDSPRSCSYSNDQLATDFHLVDVPGLMPLLEYQQTNATVAPQDTLFGPGTLFDYLGGKPQKNQLFVANGESYRWNPASMLAYHLIWQEWYRNPRVQKPAFAHPVSGKDDYLLVNGLIPELRHTVSAMPYLFYHDKFAITDSDATEVSANYVIPCNQSTYASVLQLVDGTLLTDLRQRNFGLDYFTGARVDAQQGRPASVSFDTSGSTGEFTISALRAANSLQQFRERNNLASNRMVDAVKARYGANLSDGVAQRPICIGTGSYDVYSHGISQTGEETQQAQTVLNPFSGVGAQYGRGVASGADFIIRDFVASEPGFIMVLGSLVPEVTYSSGIAKHFGRYLGPGTLTDMACSLLQNVGDQPIFCDELYPVRAYHSYIFGYQDRYADFMFHPNEAHGLMKDGYSLESFVLQRSFNSAPLLSDSFLKIPTTYLDQVLTVPSVTSGLSYWYDAMLEYKVSMPLAEFSIPSLQDPAYEHGETVVLKRNGQIF